MYDRVVTVSACPRFLSLRIHSNRRITIVLTFILLLAAQVVTIPTVPSTSAAGAKTTKLGFFYIPPTDGTSLSKMASLNKFMILTRGHERYRDQIRASGYQGDILQYLVASEVEGPGPYANASANCDESYTPLRNQVSYQKGDFCKYIHPNESWFLHNGAGKRLVAKWGTAGYWYHMNPASSGWRNFALSRMKRALIGDSTEAALGYDGILLDNVELSLVKAEGQLENSDGTVKEFSTNEGFRSAWLGYLNMLSSTLRPAGKLWGNLISDPNTGSSWNPYLQYLDGNMTEAFATGYNGLSVANWENNLEQAEAALTMGKSVLLNANGIKSDTTRQTFGLASYLLITNNRSAFFRFSKSAHYREMWYFSNYDIALGAPKGRRYQSGSTWRRDFECGSVVVNPSDRTAKISQSTCSTENDVTVSISGISNNQTVGGTVKIRANPVSENDTSRVAFYINEQRIWGEGIAPYYLGGDVAGVPTGWDTRAMRNGTYVLKVIATDTDGTTASSQLQFTIAN